MYKSIKTLLDFGFILILLPFITTLIFLISSIILVIDGGSIFFVQKRIGLNNKPFYLIKFRTLKRTAPKEIATLDFKDLNNYLTKTGLFLRKTSLDELPQIINIQKGEMSLIGPRPLIPNQFNLIKQRIFDRSNMIKPGITGLAQISTSAKDNDLEKLRFDKVYVENFSFRQDFLIFIKTIVLIINRFIH